MTHLPAWEQQLLFWLVVAILVAFLALLVGVVVVALQEYRKADK